MIICDNDEFKEAAEFYATKLGIPDTTIIAVGIYSDLPVAGYCEYHDEEVIPYFIVAIEEVEEDSDEEDPLSILAHEMVHVKQWARNELKDLKFKRMWKGEDFTHARYDEQPWEREAKKSEKVLAKKYIRKE